MKKFFTEKKNVDKKLLLSENEKRTVTHTTRVYTMFHKMKVVFFSILFLQGENILLNLSRGQLLLQRCALLRLLPVPLAPPLFHLPLLYFVHAHPPLVLLRPQLLLLELLRLLNFNILIVMLLKICNVGVFKREEVARVVDVLVRLSWSDDHRAGTPTT